MQGQAQTLQGLVDGLGVGVLLDTGATGHSFISEKVACHLEAKGHKRLPVRYTGGLGNKDGTWEACGLMQVPITLKLGYIGKDDMDMLIPALIYKDLSMDVVVGAPEILQNQLTSILDDVMRQQLSGSGDLLAALIEEEHEIEAKELVTPISDELDPEMVNIQILGPESLQLSLTALVKEFSDLATASIAERQLTGVEPLRIDLVESVSKNPKSPFRGHSRYPLKLMDQIEQFTKELLDKGIIEPSDGEFIQPVLLVSKKDGTMRFCIDFRFLNKITRSVSWPIPDIQTLIQRLEGYEYYGTLDLTSGYHQLVLDPKSKALTAFMTSRGTWQFLRVPFGLKNAPAIFQRAMAAILEGLVGNICEIYIDDVIIFARTEEEFVERVRMVFTRFRERGVIIKPSKCVLGASSIEYLGYRIDKVGYQLCEARLEAIRHLRLPRTATELRSYIGLVNCFHTFVPRVDKMLVHLTPLLKGKTKQQVVEWTPVAEQAFELLKTAALACQRLHFLQDHGMIILYTDASDVGCGASLVQVVNGVELPVAFVSKLFSEVQRRWPTNEKEMYAIVYAVEKLHHLLALRQFTVRTDHRNLQYDSKMSASAKVERWKLRLQQYDYHTEYVQGALNGVADALSRLCIMDTSMTTEQLKELIAEYHNDMVGHHGARRTLLMLQKEGHRWRDQMTDVELFVKACPVCQRQAHGRRGLEGQSFTVTSEYKLQKLSADLCGPFEPDSHGMTYILVVVDCFTKFTLLEPVKDSRAETSAAQLHRLFNNWGAPEHLLTDNGPTFASEKMKSFLDMHGVIQDTTIPYSSEGNAICERMNREVRRHLDNLATQREKELPWSQDVSQVQRILNGSPTGSGDRLPVEMVLGYNVYDWRRSGLIGSDVLASRNDIQEKWATAVREKIITTNGEQGVTLEKVIQRTKAESIKPKLCSQEWVYIRNMTRNKGDLHIPRWKGPFQVISHIDREVKVRDFVSQAELRVDVSNVRRFVPSEDVDPRLEATRDVNEYVVEDVLGHQFVQGQRKTLKALTFKIKWLGHQEPTEENCGTNSSIVKTVKVLEYMNKHPELQGYIPKRFR